jgi:transglutaminase-like putative cysteine protease
MTIVSATRLAALLLALLAVIPAGAGPDHDLWFATSVEGQRVGYVHELRRTVHEDGESLIVTDLETRMSFKRLGRELSVSSRVQTWETEDGRAVRFKTDSQLSTQSLIVRGQRRGDVFEIRTEAMGSSTTRTMPWSDDYLFPAALERRLLEAGLEPGRTIKLQAFSPDFVRPTTMVVHVKDWELLELQPGKQTKLLRLESSQDLLPGLTLIEWRNADGELVRSVLPMLGLEVESVRVSREAALKPVSSAELLSQTLVDPGVRLERPRELTRARFLLRMKSAQAELPRLPEDRRQQNYRLPDGNLLVDIRAEDWNGQATATAPAPAYLEPSAILQSEAPEVVELARKATEGVVGARDRARAVTLQVHRSITDKSLDVGLATAAEVAATLEGDCTEHAVLAAAMARAVGLPSKVATGLVYFQGTLGYHMWTEVWVDGAWRAVDAALGQQAMDATHIKLAESPLSTGFVDEGLAALVPLISALEVRLLDYVEPAGDRGGARYVFPGLGFSLHTPSGWSPPVPLPPPECKPPTFFCLELGGADPDISATAVLKAVPLPHQHPGLGAMLDARQQTAPSGERQLQVAGRPALQRTFDDGSQLLALTDNQTLYVLRTTPLPGGKAASAEALLEGMRFDQ